MMTARMFKLTLIHQRIDERLRLELRRLRPDRASLVRLIELKMRAKQALNRLYRRRAAA